MSLATLAVLPTEVVDEDGHRWPAGEFAVWALLIGGVEVVGEGLSAVSIGIVETPEGSAREEGLVETLDVTMRLCIR